MYVRVMQIKFPNELAKKSVMVLSRGVMKDYFKHVSIKLMIIKPFINIVAER